MPNFEVFRRHGRWREDPREQEDFQREGELGNGAEAPNQEGDRV
jgi:hypothetical protein